MPKTITFKQFERDFLTAIKPTFTSFFETAEGKEFLKQLFHFIVEKKDIEQLERKHGPEAIYTGILISGFSEISASFRTLRDIEILVKSITTRPTKVSKATLLSYHIHNYFNEIYILKTRLINFLVLTFRRSNREQKHKKTIQPLKELIANSFLAFDTIRGTHVHEKRFTDHDLEHLLMFELYKNIDIPSLTKPLDDLYKVEFLICRAKWLDQIKTINNAIEQLLDAYFSTIHKFIFDVDGNILIPPELKS